MRAMTGPSRVRRSRWTAGARRARAGACRDARAGTRNGTGAQRARQPGPGPGTASVRPSGTDRVRGGPTGCAGRAGRGRGGGPAPARARCGGGYLLHRHHRRLQEAFARLLARDGLVPTGQPCGLDRDQLAGRFDATPRGDRRTGIEHGVEGPAEVELGGHPVAVQVACFQWWHEERVQNKDGASYRRQRTTVAMARLPVVVPGRIASSPRGSSGGSGCVGRPAGRVRRVQPPLPRHRVRPAPDRVLPRRRDAAPAPRDRPGPDDPPRGRPARPRGQSLAPRPVFPGVLAELPAVAQDVVALLRAVPAQVWRTASPVDDREAR
jgi:hypothetical protein